MEKERLYSHSDNFYKDHLREKQKENKYLNRICSLEAIDKFRDSIVAKAAMEYEENGCIVRTELILNEQGIYESKIVERIPLDAI